MPELTDRDNTLKTAEHLCEILGGSELCAPQVRQVTELAAKLRDRELTIAVIGQFKRGKTTLVNRILGSDVLPTGIIPVTAAVTKIRCDETGADSAGHSARVWFRNGLSREVPTEQLHQYISEQDNPDNEKGVAEVELSVQADFLRDGLVLVDTPGVGSVHEENSKSAYDFARESDAVIFMLSVDSPINSIETDFLKETRRFAGRFYFTVNKIDTIGRADLDAYMKYCGALLCRLMEIDPKGTEAEKIRLLPVSAATGEGVKELTGAIRADLFSGAEAILCRSVRLKLLQIIRDTYARIASYREVLRLTPSESGKRFEQMHEMLERTIDEWRQQADADGGMLLRARLNEEKACLCEKVRDLLGVEYRFETDRAKAAETLDREAFIAELEDACREIGETVDLIFMYREENAYTVARRIEDMNILMHELEKCRRGIERQL